MKKLILFIAAAMFSLSGFSQKINGYLRERAESNLEILTEYKDISRRVTIDNLGIHLADNTNRREISMFWKEIPKLIDILENEDYYKVQYLLAEKGMQNVYASYDREVHHYTAFPTSFTDLFIALDPGHFGGNQDAAKLEARLVKMEGAELGVKNDVIFFEAELAYATCVLLKNKLTALGANVMITRPYGAGAMGLDYESWVEDGFENDVKESLKKGDISQAYHNDLQNAFKEPTSSANRYALFNYYKFLDFRARIKKINDFMPNITISVHYNASDDNKFYGDRYLKPVEENYNMMFVPGAFMSEELNKVDQKLDFIRLLLSPDIGNSITLADFVLDEHEKLLGVPRREHLTPGSRMEKATIETESPGVFARNLPLTRMVRGTVVYGESLVQDNKDEALLLSQKNLRVHDPNYGTIVTSKRVELVAQAYFNGIVRFVESNKEKQQKYDSLSASISND